MEEWKEYKAMEFCSGVTDGTHDSPKPKTFGHYLITSKHLKDNRIDFSSANQISEEDYQKVILRSAVEQYDILFSMIGTIGNTVQVKQEIVDFAVKNMGIFKMGRNQLKSTWLYYWLNSVYSKQYINQRLAGSTQSYLTLDSLRNFPVSYPGDDIANSIISILRSLDDKIEVNRRINDNLEQQAQAAFDELIMDEELPRTKFLKDYAFVNPSRTIKKGEVKRYIDMSSLPTQGSFPSDWINKPYNGGMKFQNGDTIMARITPCLENGKTAYINFLEKDEIAYGSTEYIVMTPQNGMPSEMFYFLARNEDFVSYAVAHMNGSSGRQRVSATDIENYIMPDIPTQSIELFGKKTNAVMECIKNNSFENRKLAILRDTLLPKLMSGELKVFDKPNDLS